MRSTFIVSQEVLELELDVLLATCQNSEHCSAIEFKTFPLLTKLSEFDLLKPLKHKSEDSASESRQRLLFACI